MKILTLLLACFRYCSLKINENEKQFGIMAAPFFTVEHTVHVRMTRCESLLAQATTTNNSIATTSNTNKRLVPKAFLFATCITKAGSDWDIFLRLFP